MQCERLRNKALRAPDGRRSRYQRRAHLSGEGWKRRSRMGRRRASPPKLDLKPGRGWGCTRQGCCSIWPRNMPRCREDRHEVLEMERHKVVEDLCGYRHFHSPSPLACIQQSYDSYTCQAFCQIFPVGCWDPLAASEVYDTSPPAPPPPPHTHTRTHTPRPAEIWGQRGLQTRQSGNGHGNYLQEDWGELNTGKRGPQIFVLEVDSGSVTAVAGLPADSSVGQPVWTPGNLGVPPPSICTL